jgi:hypothetical protein
MAEHLIDRPDIPRRPNQSPNDSAREPWPLGGLWGKFLSKCCPSHSFLIRVTFYLGGYFGLRRFASIARHSSCSPQFWSSNKYLEGIASQLRHFKRCPVTGLTAEPIPPSAAGRVLDISKAVVQGCLPYLTSKNGSRHGPRQSARALQHFVAEVLLKYRAGDGLISLSMFRPHRGTCIYS